MKNSNSQCSHKKESESKKKESRHGPPISSLAPRHVGLIGHNRSFPCQPGAERLRGGQIEGSMKDKAGNGRLLRTPPKEKIEKPATKTPMDDSSQQGQVPQPRIQKTMAHTIHILQGIGSHGPVSCFEDTQSGLGFLVSQRTSHPYS